MITKIKKYCKECLFFLVSFLVLFFSFQFNIFHVTNSHWFNSFQYDSETLVIGRLVKSREDGIISSQGRLGRYEGISGSILSNQTKLYSKDIIGGHFSPYDSQFGLQGITYSLIDKVLNILAIKDYKLKIEILHGITSAFLTIVLTGILYVFYLEFGLIPASITLLGILSSEWLIVFGKNLYWVAGFWFLPMLIIMYFLHLEKNKISTSWTSIAIAIFLSIFIKSLNGYEYISTILIAMITPIVYYAISLQWTWKKYIKKTLLVGVSGLFGFLFALFIHILQLYLSFGDLMKAIDSITKRIIIRTFDDPSTSSPLYAPSANADIITVLIQYFGGHFFHGHFKFIILISIIIFISTISIYVIKKFIISIVQKRTIKALLYTTWFSILAPVSWFILAKGHSFIHTHMNFVLWYLPFMIFGFLLSGYIFNIFINKKYNIILREV